MATDILLAITNLVESFSDELDSAIRGSNPVNGMGSSLEFYVRDLFCGSFELSEREKDIEHNNAFSYIAPSNSSNPPDLIIRSGDAIEVKKAEGRSKIVQLNSSHPKTKLRADDPKITDKCRNCEEEPWNEKDLLYIFGGVDKKNRLMDLWFVFGDCFLATEDRYVSVFRSLKEKFGQIAEVEDGNESKHTYKETKEISSVAGIDPLEVTNLRVRAMWLISHPRAIFEDLVELRQSTPAFAYAIMLKDKYLSFPKDNRLGLESKVGGNVAIDNIQIKSPDDPKVLIPAKLVRVWKEQDTKSFQAKFNFESQ